MQTYYLVEKSAMEETLKRLADQRWSEVSVLMTKIQNGACQLLPDDDLAHLRQYQEGKQQAAGNGEQAVAQKVS